MPRFQHHETGAEVMARQVKPGNWVLTAAWCGGWPTLVNGNQGVLVVDGDRIVGHADLGDWVLDEEGGKFRPVGAGEFGQEYEAT